MNRKKFNAFLLGLGTMLVMPMTGSAATVGNMAASQGGGGEFSIGMEYDGVFNRDLDFKSGSRKGNSGGAPFSETFPALGDNVNDMEMESNRFLLKGTLGFHRDIDLDLFIKVGVADLKWEAKHVLTAAADRKLEFDGEFDIAWGGGAKFGFYESPGGFKIMGDVQYLAYEVDGDFDINGIDRATFETPATYDSKTKIEEWQAALYVQQSLTHFAPYVGAKYSDVDFENETKVRGQTGGVSYTYKEKIKAEADDNVGVFLGTDIYIIPDKLSLNIEGRFLDETSGSLGVNYKF